MSSKADDVIMRIEKLISERVSSYVGRTTVPDLMAVARRIASTTIIQAFKAEGLGTADLGGLPEGAVFQVVQDPQNPATVQVLLQEAVRRMAERAERKAGEHAG